jgi:hypothetical protein
MRFSKDGNKKYPNFVGSFTHWYYWFKKIKNLLKKYKEKRGILLDITSAFFTRI